MTMLVSKCMLGNVTSRHLPNIKDISDIWYLPRFMCISVLSSEFVWITWYKIHVHDLIFNQYLTNIFQIKHCTSVAISSIFQIHVLNQYSNNKIFLKIKFIWHLRLFMHPYWNNTDISETDTYDAFHSLALKIYFRYLILVSKINTLQT